MNLQSVESSWPEAAKCVEMIASDLGVAIVSLGSLIPATTSKSHYFTSKLLAASDYDDSTD